jgi:ATP-dependent RNA helicase DeaD
MSASIKPVPPADVAPALALVSGETVNEQPVTEAEPELNNGDQDSQPEAQDNGFADMALAQEVVTAVARAGYAAPTEIQARIIPPMLEGRSVLAQSQTGSGKTAAFALPIISRIDLQKRKTQALVLAPTRELAIQVARSFSTYASGRRGLSVTAIYGGQSYEPQLQQLRRGAQVVVGTPGRVIDHIKRGTLDLSDVNCVVLDEADEMLHMGFIDDVQFVLEQVPQPRQVALFSATMPEQIRRIAQRYLDDPVRIQIDKTTLTVDSVRQRAVVVPAREKPDALVRFLEIEQTDGVIVFTKTREGSVTVAELLTASGFSAVALNGDMPQRVRERTIEQLKAGRLDVLVATDVAARGLDVKRISHVFNYDIPVDAESYTHRIGRTGRAGRSGEAILFVTHAERRRLAFFERTTRQPVEIVQVPRSREINLNRVARFRKQIEEAAKGDDFEQFRSILEQHTAETGQSMLDTAAALATLLQGGRPFFASDKPVSRKQRQEEERARNQQRVTDRPDRGERKPRARNRGEFVERAVERGMVRYRIEVGHDHSVKPGNIVGAIANEAGLDGDKIGSIQIHDSYSTVDLPEGMPKEIYRTLQKTRVAGQALKLRRDGAEPKNFSAKPAKDAAPFKKPAARKPDGDRFSSKPPRSKGAAGDSGKEFTPRKKPAPVQAKKPFADTRVDAEKTAPAPMPSFKTSDGAAKKRKPKLQGAQSKRRPDAPTGERRKPAGEALTDGKKAAKKPKKISAKKKAKKLEKKQRKKQARQMAAAARNAASQTTGKTTE